jgi:hypothetical protein
MHDITEQKRRIEEQSREVLRHAMYVIRERHLNAQMYEKYYQD